MARDLIVRHGPAWLLLALAAGSVNAGAFLACERFVTHMTSTVTRIGLGAGAGLLAAEYLLLLFAFVAGAMLSVVENQVRALRGRSPRPVLPLLFVVCVLVATAFAGHGGFLGEVGVRSGTVAEFAILFALTLAMGLMNATITISTELTARTTHMTGQATDFGIHLAMAWLSRGTDRRDALRFAALRGGKLVAFGLGAVVMVPVVQAAGYFAFLLPAAVVLVATLLR